MCCYSPDSYAKLVAWYHIPMPDKTDGDTSDECDWLGGHLTLQIKHDGRFAHLGWWPSYWSLFRKSHKGVLWRIWRFLKKWIWERAFPHCGRRTRYATKREQPASLDPTEFDSILAKSVQLDAHSPMPPVVEVNEAEPSYEAYLCVPDKKAALDNILKFNASQSLYHVVFNNCATVIAKALVAGGAKPLQGWIVSPSRLLEHCKARLVCQADKKPSSM
jgi:hypothetical protein